MSSGKLSFFFQNRNLETKYILQNSKYICFINLERMTKDPAQCGGKPCVRGLRIRVSDVIELLANGLSPSEIMEELPALKLEDIKSCLWFAAEQLKHPVLVAA